MPQPGQPPIGSSPATGPTQNLGLAAKGIQAVGALMNGMAMVIPLVGAGSPLGQSLAKALTDIGKHVPPGAASPQGQQDFIRQMAMKQMQMGPQQAALGNAGGRPNPTPSPGGMAA